MRFDRLHTEYRRSPQIYIVDSFFADEFIRKENL